MLDEVLDRAGGRSDLRDPEVTSVPRGLLGVNPRCAIEVRVTRRLRTQSGPGRRPH